MSTQVVARGDTFVGGRWMVGYVMGQGLDEGDMALRRVR